MSNQKRLTHYGITGLVLVMNFCKRVRHVNFQPSIRGGSVCSEPEGRGGSHIFQLVNYSPDAS